MKLTIKLFLVMIIAASTIFAEEGNMGNGGYTDDGNMGNGGITCTVNCPTPTSGAENPDGTNAQTDDETGEEDSILTIIENYLESLFG